MYHYIRNNNSKYPNFKNLTIDQFRKQIDFFHNTYGLVSKEDFIFSVDNRTPLKKGVVLTFDDGFKDHYQNVLPILEEKKAWGFFYVPTGHYEDKKILNVHRVHHLLGKCDSSFLLESVLKLVDTSMLNKDKIDEFDKEIYKDQELSSCEFQFKRLLNYYLHDEYKAKILDEITSKHLNEAELYDELYLTKEELIEMEKCGSVIGSHTVTHPVLSTLSYEQQKIEIEKSYNFLNLFLSMRCKSFCYPYGGRTTYNEDTFKALEECGVHHAFTVGNSPLNIIKNKYELTRIDCNRFK
jgi:peptidoglycan/xylan/chitin deacetylase (PgdA/CDA1 family)